MRLTTKGRFAVTAMLDLAMHDGQGPVTLVYSARDEAHNDAVVLREILLGRWPRRRSHRTRS